MFEWHKFLADIFQQKYVLVVGSEIQLKQAYSGGDSYKYLRAKYKDSDDDDYDNRKDFLANYKIDSQLFSDNLRAILETKLFRTVITTSTDDLLERVLRDIWGDELKVLNFYGDPNDISLIHKNEFNEPSPILYYAFGKALPGMHFVDDEDDKLKAVADWLNQKDKFPTSFYSYLVSKKLLALGCKQNDWLFRFFWYSLRKDVRIIKSDIDSTESQIVNEKEDAIKGKVAIELNESDESLRKYLKRKGWLYENDAQRFMTDFLANMEFNAENNVILKLLANRSKGNCFISYASEDFKTAINLYLLLKEKGFSVWIDNDKLYPGDDYDERIVSAINQCNVFIPIISKTTEIDYNSNKLEDTSAKRRYYLKEWGLFLDKVKLNQSDNSKQNKATIAPMLTDGISVKSDVYQNTPWVKSDCDKTVLENINSINKLIVALRKRDEQE